MSLAAPLNMYDWLLLLVNILLLDFWCQMAGGCLFVGTSNHDDAVGLIFAWPCTFTIQSWFSLPFAVLACGVSFSIFCSLEVVRCLVVTLNVIIIAISIPLVEFLLMSRQSFDLLHCVLSC